MPHYTRVHLNYEPYHSGNPVFVKSLDGFPPIFGKTTASNEDRQIFFNQQIARLMDVFPNGPIPVFIEWGSGEQNRMDRGCVGHAVNAQMLVVDALDPDGCVSHVLVNV